jgi:IMP dehydrogenase
MMISKLSFYRIDLTIMGTQFIPSNSDLPPNHILHVFYLDNADSGLDTGKLYGKLLGIVTLRDVQFHTSPTDLVTAVMTPLPDLVTAPQSITLEEANTILRKSKKGKLPIVDSNGHLTSLLSRSDLMKNLNFPLASKMPDSKQLICAAAIGTREEDKVRIGKLVDAGLDIVVLDSSQGNSRYQVDMIRWIKENYPSIEIIAGNVVTRCPAPEEGVG